MRFLSGGEELPHVQGLRRSVARRNVEWQAIGQNTTGVKERYGVVPYRFSVQLATSQSIRGEEEAGERELNRVLEVPALRLEVMLRQVHPFVPNHAGKLLHRSVLRSMPPDVRSAR